MPKPLVVGVVPKAPAVAVVPIAPAVVVVPPAPSRPVAASRLEPGVPGGTFRVGAPRPPAGAGRVNPSIEIAIESAVAIEEEVEVAVPIEVAAAERLLQYPAGAATMFITCKGWSAVTVSRHLPRPGAPSRPVSPASPASICVAFSVRAAPAGNVSVTSPPEAAAPPSSSPAIVTAAAVSPGLIRRSRLACTASAAGLNTGTS